MLKFFACWFVASCVVGLFMGAMMRGGRTRRRCVWCGAWFDPADGLPRYTNVCGKQCADEMDEAHQPTGKGAGL